VVAGRRPGVRKKNTATLYDLSIYNPSGYNKGVSRGDNSVSSCRASRGARGHGATSAGAFPTALPLSATGRQGGSVGPSRTPWVSNPDADHTKAAALSPMQT
jgi:hypothetical protein